MVRRHRRLLRNLLAGMFVLAALTPGAIWLRDSDLVAVRQVTVTGIDGPQAPAVRRALVAAARDMTTLHVRPGVLRAAVSGYPIVKGLTAKADFPHRLRIRVNPYSPVAVVSAGGADTAVASDGTLLRGTATRGLPVLSVGTVAATRRVTGDLTLSAVRLMGAAPAALRDRVSRLFRGEKGLTASMRRGPKLYFGGADRPRAQWMAAAAVLSDPAIQGATYVDLRLPERPAVGGLPPLPKPSTSTIG